MMFSKPVLTIVAENRATGFYSWRNKPFGFSDSALVQIITIGRRGV